MKTYLLFSFEQKRTQLAQDFYNYLQVDGINFELSTVITPQVFVYETSNDLLQKRELEVIEKSICDVVESWEVTGPRNLSEKAENQNRLFIEILQGRELVGTLAYLGPKNVCGCVEKAEPIFI